MTRHHLNNRSVGLPASEPPAPPAPKARDEVALGDLSRDLDCQRFRLVQLLDRFALPHRVDARGRTLVSRQTASTLARLIREAEEDAFRPL